MVTQEEIITKLTDSFPGAEVRCQDLTGGGDHWRVEIKAPQFSEMSMIEQHQSVYKALGDWMSGPIHALSLDTSALL